MSRSERRKVLATAMAGMLFGGISAQAAFVPYVNDFSTSVADFAATPSAGSNAWTLDTVAGTYSHTQTALDAIPSGFKYTAAVSLPDVSATTVDFTVSGTYKIDATGSFSYAGLVALADTASAGNNYYLIRKLQGQDNLQLYRFVGGTGSLIVDYDTNYKPWTEEANTFEISLVGDYVDTDSNGSLDALDLTVVYKNVTDNEVYVTSTYRDSSPLTGSFFGLRDSEANTSAAMTVTWDSFSVVPEPASAAIAGAMACGVLLARRGRRA